MGKPTGFKEYPRETPPSEAPQERIKHYREFVEDFPEAKLRTQAARCMDCGVPFCHAGCPLGNLIPDFNDLIYHNRWEEACARLHATNNFPEFTGRLCPAPCEEACVLGINEPQVTIELIEKQIVEHGWANGYIRPQPPAQRSGKKIAVVGSGPSGLACAQQLNRAGHLVTVFERADKAGGLLRYGIPDFKLDKGVIDRRLAQMEAEGIAFRTGCHVGKDFPAAQLRAEFDAVVLTGGATASRDLQAPGRDLKGIYLAMEFLPQNNRRAAGRTPVVPGSRIDYPIDCRGKHVIVIGGGDTGSDCIGTSNRHGAKSVTSFEIMPMPPEGRPDGQPWPYYPMRMRTSSSHHEGCTRYWNILTKEFIGSGGQVTHLRTVNVEWAPQAGGRMGMREVPGSERDWQADLVFLALGFLGPEKDGVLAGLGVQVDERGNVKTTPNYMTNVNGVFSAGDMHRGQSLIVWAIAEGRDCAHHVDTWLMGRSELPVPEMTVTLPRP